MVPRNACKVINDDYLPDSCDSNAEGNVCDS